MIHGFARKAADGSAVVLLGFTNTAPLFKQLAADQSTYELIEASDGDEVVGFTVVRPGEANGFLFRLHEESWARGSAAYLTKVFNTSYVCLPLKLK